MRKGLTNNLQFLPPDQETAKLAQKLIHSMLEQQDEYILPLDPRDVTAALRQPGTMRYFQKEAFWNSGSRKSALNALYQELGQVGAGERTGCGARLRFFLRFEASEDIGLEEVERCVYALLGTNTPGDTLLFQMKLDGSARSFLKVQGLIGAAGA